MHNEHVTGRKIIPRTLATSLGLLAFSGSSPALAHRELTDKQHQTVNPPIAEIASVGGEAANKLIRTDVRKLSKSVLELHPGHKPKFTLSRDINGRPVAIYHEQLPSSSPNNTGSYDFTIVTAAKNGRPENNNIVSLSLKANSNGTGATTTV